MQFYIVFYLGGGVSARRAGHGKVPSVSIAINQFPVLDQSSEG